ncbi:MAG: hypothetical protein U1F50_11015 [Rubrivivax sp.]
MLTAAAGVGAVAGVVAIVLHRRFVGELRRELAQAERSRLAFDEQMTALRHQIAAALSAEVAAEGAGDGDQRRRVLEQMLDAAQSTADFPWIETQPAEAIARLKTADDGFDTTQPAALDISLGR